MAGIIADADGVPQMGAAVALIAADGRILQKVYSNDRGAFLLERILPGIYSLRVSLASFLPVTRQNVTIEPGVRSFLSINLASLFDTLDVLRGRRPGALNDDDWTWVVRSSAGTRPALRYTENKTAEESVERASFADKNQAVLQFNGGAGRSSSSGSEADFNTSFALANSSFRNTNLLISGNVGYERQTPATAVRGTFSRVMSNGSRPEVSVTVRQIFLPGAFLGRTGGVDDRIQSLTLATGDRIRVAESFDVEYGFLFDSITYLNRLSSFSPYGRITYNAGGPSSWQVYYTEGAPHERLPGNDALKAEASDLGIFPRLSTRAGSMAIQRGRHMEASYQRKLTPKTTAYAGVYQDDLTDMAVSASVGDDVVLTDLLPDVFTRKHSFNSGDRRTSGLRAALRRKFSDGLETTFAYSYGGVLTPERTVLLTQDPDELRRLLRMHRTHALAAKLAADIPVTGTRIYAGYKWMLGHAVSIADIYDDSLAAAEPYLNILIRQPLPPVVLLPGRIEALADFRNLLAQGYVPITTADGKSLLMVQNARSFRGGFSFVF